MHSKSNQALQLALARGYRLDDAGRPFRLNGRSVRTKKDARGYHYVKIHCRALGLNHPVRLHRLAAAQRFGLDAVLGSELVRHRDGNVDNNAPSNVAVGDTSANMMDIPVAVRVRRSLRAAEFTRTCSAEVIRDIRRRRAAGSAICAIARELRMHKGKVSRIVNGTLYKTVV